MQISEKKKSHSEVVANSGKVGSVEGVTGDRRGIQRPQVGGAGKDGVGHRVREKPVTRISLGVGPRTWWVVNICIFSLR